MKKTLLALALVAGFATTASALSFNWTTSAALKFNDTALKSSTDVTGYLVYLASGSLETSYALSDDSTASSVASSIGTLVSTQNKTTALSKINGKASFDYGTYNNGDVFAMLLVYTNGSDTYYNLSSTTYTLSGISDETSTPENATFTFSNATVGESSSLTAGSGWTAVPEPSTAALALAGLALLLKRRKA